MVSSARAYVAALNRMISFMRSNAETVAAEAAIDIVAEEEEEKRRPRRKFLCIFVTTETAAPPRCPSQFNTTRN